MSRSLRFFSHRLSDAQRCMSGSGIRSAVRDVVGLCSRWEAVNLLQRACGAMDLGDCTVGKWGFYTDPVSPEALSTSMHEIWQTGDIHWPMNEDAPIHHCPYANMLGNHKARLIVHLLLSASEILISWHLRCSDMTGLPIII